jgi:hypothetical protein
MKKLIQYRIEMTAWADDVKVLYKKFLKKDENWHFALEGRFFELRTTGRNLKLEEYLKKKKIEFSYEPYINGTPITRKYQSCFDHIYHGYALLAVNMPTEEDAIMTNMGQMDCYKVIERCFHLIYNNMQGLGLHNEVDVLIKLLSGRAYMSGYNASHIFEGYSNAKKSKIEDLIE